MTGDPEGDMITTIKSTSTSITSRRYRFFKKLRTLKICSLNARLTLTERGGQREGRGRSYRLVVLHKCVVVELGPREAGRVCLGTEATGTVGRMEICR